MLHPQRFFSCLSEPLRLYAMLLVQRQGELCVCELEQALEAGQSKVSRHLAQLRNCELLKDRRQGQWVFYGLHPDLPEWALAILEQSALAESAALDAMEQRLTALCDRPVPSRLLKNVVRSAHA
jgi:ArsR family transcriptional regulator